MQEERKWNCWQHRSNVQNRSSVTVQYVASCNAAKCFKSRIVYGMATCNEVWPDGISSTVYMNVIWKTLRAAIVNRRVRWMGYWYITLCGPPLSVEESLLNDTDKQRCVGCQCQSTGIQEVGVALCWQPFTVDYWYVTLWGPPLSVAESLLNDTDKQSCVGCQYQSTGIQEAEVTLCWPPFTVDRSLL
jgi:hypothetical protein